MRFLTQLSLASTLAFVLSTPALAVLMSELAQYVQAAAGRDSNINVQIDGETVSLRGYAENEDVARRLEEVARKNGATNVNNHIYTPGTSGFGSE